MQRLQRQHASEICAGDRIHNAGSSKQGTFVQQLNWRTWHFDILNECTSSVNWVNYDNAGRFSTVLRYEEMAVDPCVAELETLAREENLRLPYPPDYIVWLEDHSRMVTCWTARSSTPVFSQCRLLAPRL